MLFRFFRHQIQREPPTISSTMRRSNEDRQIAIGPDMRLDVTGDLSASSANPVISTAARRPTAKSPACRPGSRMASEEAVVAIDLRS
jgi:hypothetical protein